MHAQFIMDIHCDSHIHTDFLHLHKHIRHNTFALTHTHAQAHKQVCVCVCVLTHTHTGDKTKLSSRASGRPANTNTDRLLACRGMLRGAEKTTFHIPLPLRTVLLTTAPIVVCLVFPSTPRVSPVFCFPPYPTGDPP